MSSRRGYDPLRPTGGRGAHRNLRVGEEVRHILSDIFMRNTLGVPELEGLALTVTEVRVSTDLRHAHAFIMTLGGRDLEPTVNLLNPLAPVIRHELGKRSALRFLPSLRFHPDHSFASADRIDSLLKSH